MNGNPALGIESGSMAAGADGCRFRSSDSTNERSGLRLRGHDQPHMSAFLCSPRQRTGHLLGSVVVTKGGR